METSDIKKKEEHTRSTLVLLAIHVENDLLVYTYSHVNQPYIIDVIHK